MCTMMFSVIHRTMLKLFELASQLVNREHTTTFHKRIFAAIENRDPVQARGEMATHLRDVKEVLDRASWKQVQSGLAARINSPGLNAAAGI